METTRDFAQRTWNLLNISVPQSGSTSRTRVAFHALILTLIIASFWTLDSLKDPVFEALVGMKWQPGAKLWSVITTLVVVCVYDFLTSAVDKHALFHIVSVLYGMIFFIICAILYHVRVSERKDPGENGAGDEMTEFWLLGYFTYFAIESFGSLMVAMFWSFTNNLMNLEDAKDVYGIIISCAQVGAVLGSTFATRASVWGIECLFLLGSMGIFTISLLMKGYLLAFQHDQDTEEKLRTRVYSADAEAQDMLYASGSPEGKPSSSQEVSPGGIWCSRFLGGFYEGLKLVMRHRYVALLFLVSTLYEVVVTILDYQFKLMGVAWAQERVIGNLKLDLESEESSQGTFADLLGHFGQVTNFTAFLISFFGFSYLANSWGVSGTLLVFPVCLFSATLVTNFFSNLWVVFISVSVIKALIFALYDPVKELLYMPTSEDIKFKAKAWIDVFGARFAKAVGSLFTYAAHGDVAVLRERSGLFVLVVSAALIGVAVYIGREFERLVWAGEVVGESPGARDGSRGPTSGPFELPTRNGRKPGDVGYDGYDLQLFEGVFDDESGDGGRNGSGASGATGADAGRKTKATEEEVDLLGNDAPKIGGSPEHPRDRYASSANIPRKPR